jgi:hypothetical protein
MKESEYQSKVIKKLEKMFPGCEIFKLDANSRQGVPDLMILWHRHWGALEIKLEGISSTQPNQTYYVEKLNEMSFAAYIYPACEEEVLNALQQAFESPRGACVS